MPEQERMNSSQGDPELHITVVAFGSGGVSLANEIALVKAALLYADRVTLASPKALLFASFAGYLTAKPEERQDALMEMLAGLPEGAEAASAWKALRKIRHRTPDQIVAMKRFEAVLAEPSDRMEATIQDILERAEAGELAAAMGAGLLDLDPLGTDRADEPFSIDAMGPAVMNLIAAVLGPSSTTHPMFSEVTRGLARAMVKEGKIEGAALAPATQAGVAGQFISALPAFPDAPMDVLLGAREKLRGPLRRFRGGVARVSRDLGDVDALDPRFQMATEDLHREHVGPALEEIYALTREMGLVTALARSAPTVARDIGLAAGSVIALAVTSGAGVEQLAAQAGAAALGAGATAIDLLGRATTRQREVRDTRDRNEFIFLYEAARELRD
jgi:hypothetical protein